MGNKNNHTKAPCTELTPVQIRKLSYKSRMSECEILEFHRQFLLECPDGLLDKKAFIDFYQKLYPAGDPKRYCKIVFKAFDKDNSGTIDFNEFCTAMVLNGSLDRNSIENVFDIFDSNDDGKLERKELENLLHAIYELEGIKFSNPKNSPKNKASEILQTLDRDRNGSISKTEFLQSINTNL